MTAKEKNLLKKTMTKKAFEELQKSRRVVNGFNTGTRTFKTDKRPSRQMLKKEVKHGAEIYAPYFFFCSLFFIFIFRKLV